VSFSLARHGAGNLFSRTVLQATTDSTGRVSANPLQLSHNTGRLEIHVKASYRGHTATQTIHQTNVVQAADAGAGSTAAGTTATTAGAPAGAVATAVGVAAVPVSAGLSVAILTVIVAAVFAGATVGGLAASGAIGGGGKTATVSVGTPHF
jgi:hypothetical protein